MIEEVTQVQIQQINLVQFSILIVDDNLENQLSVHASIQSPNYIVETVPSAQRALEAIRKQYYSLVLLELNLPDMDGFSLAEIILSEAKEVRPDIIFTSSNTEDTSLVKKGLTLGASDFIFRPFNEDILRLKIRNHFLKNKRINALIESNENFSNTSKELTDEANGHIRSVEYAKLIQERILPKIADLESKFSNSFVIYKPKEIIGGDFYMMLEVNSRQILVCADCTGHGIPGAMLSMVGYGFLKEIILEKRVFDPGEILTVLNRKIRQFFGKDAQVGSHGMDVSICSYRTDIKCFEYATARRPIYLREQNQLHELKGDMLSIGDEISEDHQFKTHQHSMVKDFWVYMFSDGVTDQFGGPKNKKFGRKNLKELIEQTNYNSSSSQKEEIREAIKEWKKNSSQTDDISLIGKYFY